MPLIPKWRPTLYICAYTCGFLLGYIMDAVCPEAHPDLTYTNRPNTWFLVQHYQRVMLAAWNMANSSKPFASILTNIAMVSRSRSQASQRGTINVGGDVWRQPFRWIFAGKRIKRFGSTPSPDSCRQNKIRVRNLTLT